MPSTGKPANSSVMADVISKQRSELTTKLAVSAGALIVQCLTLADASTIPLIGSGSPGMLIFKPSILDEVTVLLPSKEIPLAVVCFGAWQILVLEISGAGTH